MSSILDPHCDRQSINRSAKLALPKCENKIFTLLIVSGKASFALHLQKTMLDPIFILGIVKRSGTNYIRDLLCMHPDCHRGGPIWEDYYMEHAEMLSLYARFTENRWNSQWKVDEHIGPAQKLLLEHLGDGLTSFLNRQLISQGQNVIYDPEKVPLSPALRLITKSPSVENLHLFFKLLPRAQLLIIVRDGRDVTESSVKTFKKSYEAAMREWVDGAQAILDFDWQMRNSSHQYLIIKYEDLYSDTQPQLLKIMEFLKLDIGRYPFDKIENMPVRGSSELTKSGYIHWNAVEKPKDFNPIKRWSHWDKAISERFNWVAGESQRQLGYEAIQTYHPLSVSRNLLLDMFWKPVWPIRQKLRKLKYMLGV